MTKTKIEPFSVKVFAYKNKIVIYPSNYKKTKYFIPTDGKDIIGCVLSQSKKYLQISEKAIALLEKCCKGNGSVGDIDWFKYAGGHCAFSWIGPIYRVVDPRTAELPRDFAIWREHCRIIPNDVPREIKLAMKESSDINPWKLPFFDGE